MENEYNEDLDLITDDSNVAPPVCMDQLVDDQDDVIEDYVNGENKEPVEQDPDPDKVIEADLAMDPAAATESYLENIERRSAGDPKIKKYLIEKYKASLKIGFNPATKSMESINVCNKKFEKHTYKSFEDFDYSDAGIYAKEALDDMFTDTLKPVTESDFDRYKDLFTNKVFRNTLMFFRDKFMNPNVASQCSYTIDKDTYSTPVIKATFKDKNGNKSNYGCIYAFEWYKGRPICTPIVPLIKFSSKKNEQSEEKAFGYFKWKDVKKWKKEGKLSKNIDDIFKIPEVAEKAKELRQEIVKKGHTPATIQECKDLPVGFFTKYIRGVNPHWNDMTSASIRFTKKDGIVWGYWIIEDDLIFRHNKFFGQRMSIVAMTKNPAGKLSSIMFAAGIPIDKKFDNVLIDDHDKKSKESYSYEEFDFDKYLM